MATAEDVRELTDGWTIATLLRRNATEYADVPAVHAGVGPDDPTWTWSKLRADVAAAARGLESLGLARGDRMLIMMATRPEHIIADLGAMTLGAMPCTAYQTLSTEQIRFVARQSQAVVVVLEGADQLTRWAPVLDDLPALRWVVMLDEQAIPAGDDRFVSYRQLIETGRAAHQADPQVVERCTDALRPQDPLCMLYTSGTTGDPKGVVISHGNAVWEAAAVETMNPVDVAHPRSVSYLPLAHIAERVLSIYLLIYRVGELTICPDQTQLLPTLNAVRPHAIFGVPRVWEKFAAGVQAKLAALPEEQRSGIESARAVALRALHVAAKGDTLDEQERAQLEAIDAKALRPIRGLLGLDEADRTMSGAAALPTATMETLGSLGIRVLEVWGLSETTGAATVSTADAFAPAAVGKPIPGVEVRVAEDSEILVRGPIVFLGYLADDGSISKATDEDGWLATGDIGEFDERGLLHITDRKKELIITSGGKNVAPSRVEGILRGHPLIGQAAVIGDNRPYLTALLSLDEEGAPAWAKAHGMSTVDLAELASHPDVLAEIERAVAEANNDLSRAEQVKRYHITHTPWTAESGELTPTLKLRRRIISAKYAAEIEGLYS